MKKFDEIKLTLNRFADFLESQQDQDARQKATLCGVEEAIVSLQSCYSSVWDEFCDWVESGDKG